MLVDPVSAPPSGWYPDPGGASHWRIWNGREWTDHTRPYGEPAAELATRLDVVRAHDALVRYGIACYFGGYGLVADAFSHRPLVDTKLTTHVYGIVMAIGLTVFLLGHLAMSRAYVTFRTRQLLTPHIPILNVWQWAWLSQAVLSYPPSWLPGSRRDAARARQSASVVALITMVVAFALPLEFATTNSAPTALTWVAVHVPLAVGAFGAWWWARAVRDDLVA